jgi:hypothetical protein
MLRCGETRVRAICLAGVVVVALGTLGAASAAGQDAASACPTAWSKTAASCGGGLVRIDKPFTVRAVEGTLADAVGRTWPGGVEVVIELTEVGNPGRRRSANAEVPSGRFRIKDAPAGRYCFRVGVQPSGWSCVEGLIVVSLNAAADARVDVAVPLGK